jgi:hypothetical protein
MTLEEHVHLLQRHTPENMETSGRLRIIYGSPVVRAWYLLGLWDTKVGPHARKYRKSGKEDECSITSITDKGRRRQTLMALARQCSVVLARESLL